MKATELKSKGIKFKLYKKEYELKLDLNTFCELEEMYGDLESAFDDLQNMKLKAVRALIYAAIKTEDEKITLKKVGEGIKLDDLERLSTVISEALELAMPEEKEDMGETKAT